MQNFCIVLLEGEQFSFHLVLSILNTAALSMLVNNLEVLLGSMQVHIFGMFKCIRNDKLWLCHFTFPIETWGIIVLYSCQHLVLLYLCLSCLSVYLSIYHLGICILVGVRVFHSDFYWHFLIGNDVEIFSCVHLPPLFLW
jgi:hypothetical protein